LNQQESKGIKRNQKESKGIKRDQKESPGIKEIPSLGFNARSRLTVDREPQNVKFFKNLLVF
jgi:hypothetical protein